MTTISGLRLKRDRRMNHWHSLIEEWVLAHERYARFSVDDAAYWYTERANIGVLAGAAWRCGMVAIEEFQTTKDNSLSSRIGDRKTWKGRCDLWIARDGHQEIIEAKYRPISLRSKMAGDIAAAALSRAVGDAINSRWAEELYATGLVFLPVFSNVRFTESSDTLVAKIETLVEELWLLDPTLLAWCFPDATRKLLGPNRKCYWPGLIMLGVCER